MKYRFVPKLLLVSFQHKLTLFNRGTCLILRNESVVALVSSLISYCKKGSEKNTVWLSSYWLREWLGQGELCLFLRLHRQMS